MAAWFSSISTFANKIAKTHSNLSSTTMCEPIGGFASALSFQRSWPPHRLPQLPVHSKTHSGQPPPSLADTDGQLQLSALHFESATSSRRRLAGARIFLRQTRRFAQLAFATNRCILSRYSALLHVRARRRAWLRGFPQFPHLPTKSQKPILICLVLQCADLSVASPRHFLSNAHGHLTGCHSCQSTPRHTAVSRRPRLQIQMDSFSCPRCTLKAQHLLDAVLQAPEFIETDATICTACSICNKQVHSQQIQCIASCPRKAARVAAWFSSISTFANKIAKTHSNLSSTTMCGPIGGFASALSFQRSWPPHRLPQLPVHSKTHSGQPPPSLADPDGQLQLSAPHFESATPSRRRLAGARNY